MKKYHVDLTAVERVRLAQIIQKRNGQSEIVKRAYILQAAVSLQKFIKRC